jgi:hypothetical protein
MTVKSTLTLMPVNLPRDLCNTVADTLHRLLDQIVGRQLSENQSSKRPIVGCDKVRPNPIQIGEDQGLRRMDVKPVTIVSETLLIVPRDLM